jgi:hypothetical protein
MGIPPHSSGDGGRAGGPGRTFYALQQALEGRYALEEELGRGGMGIVYLAWERELDRMVALKLLSPARTAPRQRERFLREARAAARLSHPNIVPIYTVDQVGPFVYYTMAYIEGETLDQRVKAGGPLSPGEAARILRDVAWAVDYAHQHGVIHRDLKPQNILIETKSGRALVADFGIARVLSEPPLPGTGYTIGTCEYASPEQLAGLPTDERSDVYSLGVTGYEIATGELPFTGTDDEIKQQHLTRPAPPLPVVGMHLDTTLARCVGRCLAKNPSDRFQTAAELAAALSLAPELRADLPRPLRKFLRRLDVVSRGSTPGVLAGFFGLLLLGGAVQHGAWQRAAGLTAGLGVLLAAPLLAALPVTRRLLQAGYGRDQIVHALSMHIGRQEEDLELPPEGERLPDAKVIWVRRVVGAALAAVVLGGIAALLRLPLPPRLVYGSMSIGSLVFLFAGFALVGLHSRRNQIAGSRWRDFYRGPLGGWMLKLAGLKLRRGRRDFADVELLPDEAADLEPEPRGAAVLTSSVPGEGALPRLVPSEGEGEGDELAHVVRRSRSCVRRGRAWLSASSSSRTSAGRAPTRQEEDFEGQLERQLARLEAIYARLRRVDAAKADARSLTADLEAARDVCVLLEGMIDAREWPA